MARKYVAASVAEAGGSWDQGHIPGAVHLPTASADRESTRVKPGPSSRARAAATSETSVWKATALALAELGYQVKEMRGGFEYWAREGLPYATPTGPHTNSPDPLTRPVISPECDC